MRQQSKGSALEWLARLGYSARGIVYLIVGALAVLDALGPTEESTDSKGALEKLLTQPFGDFLLGVVALGLVGYSIWRFVQAGWDVDNHGADAKGLAIRGGLLVSAVTHVGLAVFALSLIFAWGTGNGDEDQSTQDWTAWLLSQTLGQWLVGAVGVAMMGAGLAHAYKAWKIEFGKRFVMDRQTLKWVSPICQFGLFARGIVFTIIGGFFIIAAVRFNSGEARGLKGALEALEVQPYGPILLGIVALGLVAFGIYSFIEAGYRRVNHPKVKG